MWQILKMIMIMVVIWVSVAIHHVLRMHIAVDPHSSGSGSRAAVEETSPARIRNA